VVVVSGRRRAIATAAAQIHAAAVEPLPRLAALAVILGAAAVVGLSALLRPNGITARLPAAIAYAITREVIPPLVAAALIARSGAAITRAAGRGALPRAFGVTAAATGLGAWLTGAAIAGGPLLAAALGLAPAGVDARRVIGAVTAASLLVGLGKAGAFGLAIAAIHGAHARRAGSSRADGARAGARGVVHAALACAAIHAASSLFPVVIHR
jgi:ABC-type transporter Mla maintaining outer membrane lipid asymmetry permease subunit MlaE